MTYCKSPMSSLTSPKARSPRPRTSKRPLEHQKWTPSSKRCEIPTVPSYNLSPRVSQILKKGELQVGEKEREHDLSSVRREIATLVAEKCVDPATQRPYPVGVIDKAMNEAGFSVKPGKTAKAQVSECIKLLQSDSGLPIQRARMRVKVTVPVADAEKVRAKVLESAETVEKDEQGAEQWDAVSPASFSCLLLSHVLTMYSTKTMLIDPGQFRVINELLQKECKGRGRLETLTFAATASSN